MQLSRKNDDTQVLEDSGGLFELCFVELLLEQLSETVAKPVYQFSLEVDQQSQIAIYHIVFLCDVEHAV
jgi:hypothetical protein